MELSIASRTDYQSILLLDILTPDNPQLSEPKNVSFSVEAIEPNALTTFELEHYLEASRSPATRRAYASDLAHFLSWGGTLPSNDRTIAAYIAEHAAVLTVATLQRRLASLRAAHRALGLCSPTESELVGQVMKGIRRVRGRAQRRVRAIRKEDLTAMLEPFGAGTKDRRDRALLLIGFAGAFRRSELVAINCNDIEWLSEGITITMARSKVDPEGFGRSVAIPYGRSTICPVRALRSWLDVAGIRDGPVFRSVDRCGKISSCRLSAEAVALTVKERAAAAGMDPSLVSGHSLRAGLATSAAAAGVSSWKIRQQTGHASDQMLHRYIRDGELFRDNAAGAIF